MPPDELLNPRDRLDRNGTSAGARARGEADVIKRTIVGIGVSILLLALPGIDAAQSAGSGIGLREWGMRAGLGVDPDQALVGLQWDLGEFVSNLRFQPDIELGVGDDALTFYGTAPVHYLFNVDAGFTPYAGGGVALGLVNVDLPEEASDDDDTSFEAGLRAVGGLEWERKNGKPFAVELNLGIGDVHDFQVKVWWNW